MWVEQQKIIVYLLKQFCIAYRAGIPWRDIPERFGDFRVIYIRHSRWAKSEIWEQVFKELSWFQLSLFDLD